MLARRHRTPPAWHSHLWIRWSIGSSVVFVCEVDRSHFSVRGLTERPLVASGDGVPHIIHHVWHHTTPPRRVSFGLNPRSTSCPTHEQHRRGAPCVLHRHFVCLPHGAVRRRSVLTDRTPPARKKKRRARNECFVRGKIDCNKLTSLHSFLPERTIIFIAQRRAKMKVSSHRKV